MGKLGEFCAPSAKGRVDEVWDPFVDGLERVSDAILRMAYFDPVSGLPNRYLLMKRLEWAISAHRALNEFLAVLFLDLDDFKSINDVYGHSAGDALLREVGQRIWGSIRAKDTVARWGGDEFAVVLMGVKDGEEAMAIASEIVNAIRSDYFIEGIRLDISASVGISLYPVDAMTCEGLLRKADQAMYKVKAQGGNGCRVYRESAAPTPVRALASSKVSLPAGR